VIFEVAILNVKPGQEAEFEAAFRQAAPLIAATPGYIGHELQRRIETPNRYLLLAKWESVEAHTVGFRGSPQYEAWKALLHHFYDPFPTVEHYELTFSNYV
jgi:heme-degrading monooxygenase HmoA